MKLSEALREMGSRAPALQELQVSRGAHTVWGSSNEDLCAVAGGEYLGVQKEGRWGVGWDKGIEECRPELVKGRHTSSQWNGVSFPASNMMWIVFGDPPQ